MPLALAPRRFKLGLQAVPVHVASGLTPAQVKAYRIADNKTAEPANWDQDLLVQELAALQRRPGHDGFL
jgi:ParB-like chromosome segregation protein Spo0J